MCGGWKKKKWSVYYHEFIVCKFPTNFGHHIDYICWLMLGRAWEWTWNRKTWLWIWMHFLAALTTLFFPPTITWCHSNAYWPRALTSADKNVYHIKKSKFWTNTKFNYGLQRKKAHKCRQEKMTPKIAKVHRQTGCWLDYSTEYTWSAYQLNLNGCAVERTWFTLIYSN